MSLLLDALKKAEEAKRQATASAANAGNELSLEPVAEQSPAPLATSALPDLAAHFDSVDADLAAVSTTPPLRKPAPTEPKRPAASPASELNAERDAVRNVFSAKRTPPPNRNLLWLALAGVGLAALGVGGWFWWQLNSIGSGSLAARPPAAIAPAPQSLTPPLPAVSPVAAAAPAPEAVAPLPAPEYRPERPARAAAPLEPESPVRISRGELRVNPNLAKAYERFQADDLENAGKSYEQVLSNDPRNTDALLGMAAIAQRTGQLNAAEHWYIRALEADPKNSNAQAGLVNLRGQADPAGAESRLKGMLAAQPESATLNFALGNLYAKQRRWPDAQLAYFNAHTADPANPDYLFNLAASLDNMHMPKLALEYYQAALNASSRSRAGFDPAQVKARIIELQR